MRGFTSCTTRFSPCTAWLTWNIISARVPMQPLQQLGIWEAWLEGGTLFFCNSLACIPYLLFHAAYSGPNVVTHTMWPHKSCIQWHTLHHLVHSDVYAINVPSKMDKQFSRDVKQYQERLQCSFFVRYADASDGIGFLVAFAFGILLNYGFSVGIFQVWHERVLHMTA